MKALLVIIITGVTLLNLKDSNIADKDGNWHKLLPPCPCINPDLKGVKISDGWAKDKGDLSRYHRGASECFRSYPYVETSAGNSCQQCCYDGKGILIQSGSGAGTPDKVSTCAGEDKEGVMKVRSFALFSHYFKDVQPWKKAGSPENAWKIYNQEWVPSQVKCDSL